MHDPSLREVEQFHHGLAARLVVACDQQIPIVPETVVRNTKAAKVER